MYIYLVLHKDAQGEEEVTYATYNPLAAERTANRFSLKTGEKFYIKAHRQDELAADFVREIRKTFNF